MNSRKPSDIFLHATGLLRPFSAHAACSSFFTIPALISCKAGFLRRSVAQRSVFSSASMGKKISPGKIAQFSFHYDFCFKFAVKEKRSHVSEKRDPITKKEDDIILW